MITAKTITDLSYSDSGYWEKPNLKGSEKQIEWAHKIIGSHLDYMLKKMADYQLSAQEKGQKLTDELAVDIVLAHRAELFDGFLHAGDWIDERSALNSKFGMYCRSRFKAERAVWRETRSNQID